MNKKGKNMELTYEMQGDRLVVSVPKELDHHVAQSMSREIDFLADTWHAKTVLFDFSETEFMDSSGIGVLIGRKKNMEMHNGTVLVRNLGERAGKIFEKSGLSRIIKEEK